jgi:hypothetical protein
MFQLSADFRIIFKRLLALAPQGAAAVGCWKHSRHEDATSSDRKQPRKTAVLRYNLCPAFLAAALRGSCSAADALMNVSFAREQLALRFQLAHC